MDTRRAFVARLLGVAAAPVLMTGCRRQPTRTPPPVSTTNAVAQPGSPLPIVEPVVRVRVHRARGRRTSVTLGRLGQRLRLRHVEYDDAGIELPAPVAIAIDRRGWRIVDGDLVVNHADAPASLHVMAADRSPIDLAPRKRTYPGGLRLVWRSDQEPGAFDVINHVALESYLPGVLASELFSHWREETYAAQAIAARSFACSEHAYFLTRRHYDLSDAVSSQVYAGVVDRRVADHAVAGTRGIVLEHQGRLVPGYYSSCCGGLAARAADAIGPNLINTIAPLEGRSEPDVCTDAPVYEWTTSRELRTLRRRLVAYARSRNNDGFDALDDIDAIVIAERNQHGRPVSYRITDRGGHSTEIGSETFFRSANASGDGLGAPDEPLLSSFVEVKIENGRAAFNGRGFGHGVGLCQYGAESLARRGEDHRAILQWYYPGATLLQTYGSVG